MAYNTDQLLELIRRDLVEFATILAGCPAVAKDRATVNRLAAVAERHSPPAQEDLEPWPWDAPSTDTAGSGGDDPPPDDLSMPARPA